jgi:hypothetical protein
VEQFEIGSEPLLSIDGGEFLEHLSPSAEGLCSIKLVHKDTVTSPGSVEIFPFLTAAPPHKSGNWQNEQ